MQKTVFIAHPVGGDIEGNIKKILAICEEVHSSEIIPVAPYLVSLQYLNDGVVEDRELGILANLECFRRHYIDELWLFGDRISDGMKREIIEARVQGIPVIAKTDGTKRGISQLIQV